ncbi:MAG: DHA2 family efflux MFS transporter permease subunit [Candidatus Obscuribacterales bacterium]|nr:DHA2 family efflux MFS transporter permease subunit [Steroidobacteraceae bacterium]
MSATSDAASRQAGAASPPAARVMVVIAVMSATMMQMLDTTIVNVALPQMQGQLGTTASEISWVLTSYIVAASIFMPLTGYFTDRLGQRRYLLLATSGFVVASTLCGLSLSLSQIVLFRIAQGIAGAALAPLSQAIMTSLYPPEERGKAMALWGMGVTLGPILGPSLGGLLTEWLSWRWTFFINIPVGIISILLAARYLPDSPKRERTMDWTGFVLLGLAVGALQFVLDRGSKVDWFEAHEIVLATMLCVISLTLFIKHILSGSDHPIFDPRIFLDRNFVAATLTAMALSLGIFGSMVLQPILMESLLGYPVSTTGLLMAPRGFAVGIGMLIVGRLSDRIDMRILVLSGMACSFFGSVAMARYTLEVDFWTLTWPGLLQGVGIALVMVPLSVYAYTTLTREKMAEAAGMNNLIRNLGSSIGISLAAMLFLRYSQAGWQQFGGYANAFNPAVQEYLDRLNLSATNPLAGMLLAREVGQQAAIASMSKVYWLIAATGVIMAPIVLLLRPAKKNVTSLPPIHD